MVADGAALSLLATAALTASLDLVPADPSGRATLNYEPGSFRYELEALVEAVEQEFKRRGKPERDYSHSARHLSTPGAKELSM